MALVAVTLSALGIYIGVIIATRLGGLRSFSKMSGFDFAMTVAVGSLIASTIVAPEPPLTQGLVAVAQPALHDRDLVVLRVDDPAGQHADRTARPVRFRHARHDQRLRTGPAFHQAAIDKHLVETFLRHSKLRLKPRALARIGPV